MGVYDVIKDAVTVARNAGNVELSLELAKVADDLLDKQKTIQKLEEENSRLKELKKYKFAENKNYLVDSEDSNRRFCPLCTRKHQTPVPLHGVYCSQCKGQWAR